MIFVTVGTNEAPFERLLHAVAELEVDEEIVVQHGSSTTKPENARCVDFLPYDELVELVSSARLVIMHGGVGSVMTALARGASPVVVPRSRRYGEAVDEHQLRFAEALDSRGLVRLVRDPLELRSVVHEEREREVPPVRPDPRLVASLRAALLEKLGPPQSAPQ